MMTTGKELAEFPDEKDAAVVKAEIGSGIVVKGEGKLLADREGKLSKKNEYDLKKQEDGSSTLVFKDETSKGLKVLVVLK